VSNERDPKKTPHLDEESDRGDISKDGFGDYDKEFHPSDVEIGNEEPPTEERESSSSSVRAASLGPAARERFEIHFRTMKLRT